MSKGRPTTFNAIREAMASFALSSRVEPNEEIKPNRATFPEGHRGVLDLRRQLVVGNRGMGKSFWTHALLSAQLRTRLADIYSFPALSQTQVVIGFNGSDKLNVVAPTTDEIAQAVGKHRDPDLIWRAVFLRACHVATGRDKTPTFGAALENLATSPETYSQVLTEADERLVRSRSALLVVFDALDRLANDWLGIRSLTKALLIRALGLQSFRAIRMKIFMRADQFGDVELFRFPDSSKIRNDSVDLKWRPYELYGLLLFELLRNPEADRALKSLAEKIGARRALPSDGRLRPSRLDEQSALISAIAGEFMGSDKKRGRVYTWVPLHLSDAASTCSPRTFLTAWRAAAEHVPPARDRAVDHLGLIDGVRKASTLRLQELREDYPWIDSALKALRRQFVPIEREELFALWRQANVLETILREAEAEPRNAPAGLNNAKDASALLTVMTSIAVMELRANGKINVPDIFRIDAEILRKGGVAVPRRN